MGHWLSSGGTTGTRFLALCFLASDVVISSSLILLLLMKDRGPLAWAERTIPFGRKWLWRFLVGLAVLCYLGLAPTYLFLLLQMRR
jgi:hypothetical protein